MGLLVLMSLACGDFAASTSETTQTTMGSTTITTESTTTTPTLSTTTTAPAIPAEGPSAIALSKEGEAWDVLIAGFEVTSTRLPGELLADQFADELGVEVRLYEPAGFGHVDAATLVQQLRGDRHPSPL